MIHVLGLKGFIVESFGASGFLSRVFGIPFKGFAGDV